MEIDEAKQRAQSGPLILIARRGAAIIISFVSTVIVARLVAPRDYGLANMSGIVLAFASIFRDFGLTAAVFRSSAISQGELSLLFWFNAGATIGLSAVVALASPAIAYFYREPTVAQIILLSLVGFLATGLSLQHRAIISRSLRFGTLAITDTIGSLLGLALTIILAFHSLGVWAIVAGGVFQSVVTSVAFVRLSGWKPSYPKRDPRLGSFLRFGGNSSVFAVSVFISGNLAPIVIGKLLGSSGVGQYNRAQSLVNLPIVNIVQPLTQSAMPLLTHLRSDALEYRSVYLQLVKNLSTALMPISVCLVFVGPALTQSLIGPMWRDAGLIFSALAPTLAVTGFSYGVADLLITQDRSSELRSLGLIEVAIRGLAVGIGTTHGLVGAACGFSISTGLIATFRVYIAGRRGPVTAIDQLSQALPAVPLCLGATAGFFSATALRGMTAKVFEVPVELTMCGACALMFGYIVPSSRQAVIELVSVFRFSKRAT